MKSSRNYGLDLLNIIAMLMVLMLHLLYNLGLLDNSLAFSGSFFCSWFLECFCYVAVNTFVLVTGYFSWRKHFKASQIVNKYITIIFFSAISILINCSVGNSISLKQLINCIIPITSRHYWYITVYVMLYLLNPLLNHIVKSLEHRTYRNMLFVMFGVFSVLSTIYPIEDTFQMNAGQSLPWFIFLYLFAAFVSKYSERLGKWANSNRIAIVMVSAGFGASYLSKIIISFVTSKIVGNIVGSAMFIKYNSFTVFIESVGLLLLFRNLSINKNSIVNTIRFFRPHTLAAYLITEHVLLKDFVWRIGGHFISPNNAVWPIEAIVYVIILFVFCVIIDWVRDKIFGLIHIKELFKIIDIKIGKIMGYDTLT